MRELLSKSGHELLELINRGELDHNELQETQFEFAREIDSELNAFIAWDEVVERQEWSLPGLDGGPRKFSRLPYAAKDLFCTRGLQTTAGSRVLEGYEPPYDAMCIAGLRKEKNHLIGKTNMDEFAMGSSGEMSGWGVTRNPWALDRVPGGSSSGSAAAVAACQCVMALGTDTGGSVRPPAAFCGIVGYRPTYGLVSRYGMVAFSSSCDQAGIFARSTLDAALVMNTISGPCDHDSTCVAISNMDYFGEAQRDVHWGKLRVGRIKQFCDKQATDAGVLENYDASLKLMEQAGAEIVDLDFSLAEMCLPAYYIITAAECSSNLARYDGIRYGAAPTVDGLLERYLEVRSKGIGEEVKRRILLGTYVLSAGYFDAYYNRARRLRADIQEQLLGLFKQADIIATPTSPTAAFKFGEKLDDPVQMYLSDICTAFVNLAGLAGISLPNGFCEEDGARLPTGLQFACAPMRDQLMLRVAHQYEQLSGWRFQPPKLASDRLQG